MCLLLLVSDVALSKGRTPTVVAYREVGAVTRRNDAYSRLTSDQHGLFSSAVHQSGDRSGLGIKVLHLCPVSEIINRNFSLGVSKNKFALPG